DVLWADRREVAGQRVFEDHRNANLPGKPPEPPLLPRGPQGEHAERDRGRILATTFTKKAHHPGQVVVDLRTMGRRWGEGRSFDGLAPELVDDVPDAGAQGRDKPEQADGGQCAAK